MMRQALKAGAGAYVRKSALYTDLLSAVETLRNGKSSFEPAANEKHSVVHDDQEIQLRSKAFEKELAESEERFRLTFEQAAVGMALVAEDGRLLRVNRKLCDILGYSQDELRDITYQEITHPDDVREDTVRAARVAAGELDQYSIDKRYVRKDGSIVWANLTVGAVRDPDRKLKYFVSVVEDISARKLAEEKLLLAQQELALTAAHREAEAKALARLNEWNSRLLRITNLREGLFSILGAVIEMLGADKGNVQLLDPERNVLTIEAQCGFQPDFLEFFKEVSAKDASACGRALVSGERVVIEDVETDGAYVSFRAIARAAGYRAVISTPLIDVDGKPLGIVSAHFASPHRPTPESLRRLDLYARQAAAFIQRCKAEEALRESEARFRALSAKFENLHAEAELQLSKYHELFTNAPAALCLLTGPDHRFTFVNRECLRMTRRSRIEDLLGKSAREAMPELEPQGYFALLDQVYRSGIAYVGTEMPVALEEHGSGRQQQAFINFTVQPIRNAIGQVEGLLFHGVEVTSQVAARRELESSEQRLRLAQAAGHIGSWEWDPDNQAVLSPELHKMFGTSPDDPDRLQSWLVHVHPDDAARVQQLMREGYHLNNALRWASVGL
jgi:PAS domain S-box-containing protein